MTIQEVMLRIEIPEEVRENIGKYSLSEKEFYEWKHLFENDFETLAKFTQLVGNRIMIVGDDYFVTNEKYLEKGIDMHAGNAILLKANQIGTVSEMIKTIMLAKKNNYKTIISHRSGETEDTFIADLAVGLAIPFIKTGSMCRGERIAKYNRLMRIEEKLKRD